MKKLIILLTLLSLSSLKSYSQSTPDSLLKSVNTALTKGLEWRDSLRVCKQVTAAYEELSVTKDTAINLEKQRTVNAENKSLLYKEAYENEKVFSGNLLSDLKTTEKKLKIFKTAVIFETILLAAIIAIK